MHEALSKQGKGPSTEWTSVFLEMVFGNCHTRYFYDTLQCDDYAKYHILSFDEKKKRKIHEEQWPKDLQAAFDLGVQLTKISK